MADDSVFDPSTVDKEMARRSFLTFCQRIDSEYTAPKHLQILCGLLEDLEANRIQRLVVSMPPRHGKSRTCSELFGAWFLGRDPRREIILANHSADLASGFSRKAKAAVEHPKWPFENIKLSEDSRAVGRWHVTQGGGLVAAGVGSQITGVGASLLCIDDPCNDALSQTDLDAAWEWYCQIAFPRLNSQGKVLVVSARLAETDLIGRIRESPDADTYTFISLPAFNDPDNPYGLPAGEPLWPEKFDEKALGERREAMGLGAFQAQYLQDPSVAAGGKLFRIEDFGTWEHLPSVAKKPWDPLQIYYVSPLEDASRDEDGAFLKLSAIDCAGTENVSSGGSFNAVVTVLVDMRDGNVYVLDVFRSRNQEFHELRNAVVIHLARHGPNAVFIESNDGTGGRLIGDLSRTTRWPIRPVKPKTSKMERALQVIGMVESGKVFLPARASWLDAFKAEVAAFGPGARYSDQVDALVWCLLGARQSIAVRREDDHLMRQLQGFSLFER